MKEEQEVKCLVKKGESNGRGEKLGFGISEILDKGCFL